MLLDAASGTVVVEKVLTTPVQPARRRAPRRHRSCSAAAGVRPSEITAPIVHATTLITNALIEGKAGRAAPRHHPRLRRHAADPRRAPLRHVRPADRVPGAADPPRPDVRDRRAGRSPTGVVHRGRRATTTSPALTAALAAADVEAVGICLLNSYVNAANERRIAEHLRSRAGRAGVHLGRRVAADPRVPAHGDDGVQRGDDAGDRPVPRRAAEVAVRRGLRRRGADDAVQRRGRVGRRRRPHPDPPRRVRPGRRCARRQLVRQAPRRGPPAVLRHGRHDGQGLPRRARRAEPDDLVRGRPHLPVQEGLRLPGVGAVDRPRRDRRRRRIDRPHRPVRPAQGRPGVGRRRTGPGVVRPRRHRAGGHRRRRRARPARSGRVPRRRHAARR